MRSLLPILVVLLLPSVAAADIWRCTEADGTVHFTNVRPSGASCQLIARSRATPPDRSARGAPNRRNVRRPRDRYTRYNAIIEEAARLYQLPEPFIRAVMKVESDFTPDVVSHAGAMGLMQLMPRTAASMGVRDPFDPRQNIMGGSRYLRVLANKFNGDLVLTIAAYNAGEGAVIRHRGVPPYAETRRYVQRVLRHYYGYRAGR
ncbi:MAG: lytic transglycosylase domain-containing protein [Myxococcota bacterium]